MNKLAERIICELANESSDIGFCAVFEPELQDVCPATDLYREQKIALFAKEHGFKLTFYKRGFCAVFEKANSAKSER